MFLYLGINEIINKTKKIYLFILKLKNAREVVLRNLRNSGRKGIEIKKNINKKK